jgi:hypothetical protein
MASSSAGTTIALDVKASVTIDGEVFHVQGHSAGVVAQSMTGKTITLEVKASVTIDNVPASIQDKDTSEASPEPKRLRMDTISPWMGIDDPIERRCPWSVPRCP